MMVFVFSPFCDYVKLECVRIYVIYRVNQAEYVIHKLVVAPQEYVSTHPTRRVYVFAVAEREVERRWMIVVLVYTLINPRRNYYMRQK